MPKTVSIILGAVGLYVIVTGFAPFFGELQPFERIIVGIILLAISYKLTI